MKFLSEKGYFVSALIKDGNLILGGHCNLDGAISPNTGLPLTQFAHVYMDSKLFWIPEWQLPDIHFLYSWKCKIHEGDFSYRYVNGMIEIMEFVNGNDNYEEFPYKNYPVLFDDVRLGLQPISKEDQLIIIELNNADCDDEFKFNNTRASELSIPNHQFGGIPYLLFSEEFKKNCVICGHEMPIIASIGNNSYSDNQGFFGNDFVQVIYWACASCHVVSALNFCD